jgi:hypothetical protein
MMICCEMAVQRMGMLQVSARMTKVLDCEDGESDSDM